jgi:hypothetical protein
MPKARRPPTLAAPSPAMATSTTVAETAEPVTTSRTTQHAATPPVIAQRLRLRRRSGACACRRAASLPSVIEYCPRSVLDASDRMVRSRHRECGQRSRPVNGSRAASRCLEVARERSPGRGQSQYGHLPGQARSIAARLSRASRCAAGLFMPTPRIVAASAASRFLEKALNSPALNLISPRTGMLPRRCRTKIKAGNHDWPSRRLCRRCYGGPRALRIDTSCHVAGHRRYRRRAAR